MAAKMEGEHQKSFSEEEENNHRTKRFVISHIKTRSTRATVGQCVNESSTQSENGKTEFIHG